MKMKKTLCCLSIILLAVGLVAAVNAKPFGKFCEWRKNHANGHGIFRKVVKDLDLSDEQKSEIAGILKSTRPVARELGDNLRKGQKALTRAVLTEPFDEAIVREAWSDVASKKEDLTVLLAKSFATIQEILTFEQKEQLQSIYSEIADHIDERIDYSQYKLDRWIEKFVTIE